MTLKLKLSRISRLRWREIMLAKESYKTKSKLRLLLRSKQRNK